MIVEAKTQLRRAMTDERAKLSLTMRSEASELACEHAARWIHKQGMRSILVYVPFRTELDTRPLIEYAWKQGIEVYVPRCIRLDRSMSLHRLQGWDELTPGAFGILEPDPRVSPECEHHFVPEAIIVPGLAFDRTGGRLGYGQGYYDRLYERLMNMDSKGKRTEWAGIGFAMQVVECVPMDRTDAKLQILITEHGVERSNKGAEDGFHSF